MRKKFKIISIILLAAILFAAAFLIIYLSGNKFEYYPRIYGQLNNAEEVLIEVEDETIVKVSKTEFNNGKLSILLEAQKPGKTYININNKAGDSLDIVPVYVNNLGIINCRYYFGDCNNGFVLPLALLVWLLYVEAILIITLKENIKENLYQYKNITCFALIIFILFSIIRELIECLSFEGIYNWIDNIQKLFLNFSFILLPIAFVVSVLVTISNIVLIKKEGFGIKNLLGLILGVLFVGATLFPDWLYSLMSNSTIVDIHEEQSIDRYLYELLETTIYAIITYFECVLIGTIIITTKSAKHVPKFDKDYIIILGCQIRKDGTLTNLLKGRVDRAIEFANMQKEKMDKDIIFVPSGGKGFDEVIAEAEAIKNYLLDQGISKEKILVENKSSNTEENMKFSCALIGDQKAKIAFSTTNYHTFRAGILGTKENEKIEGIGAKSKSYFWINAFIREFVASTYQEGKRNLFIIFMIFLYEIILMYILYIAGKI